MSSENVHSKQVNQKLIDLINIYKTIIINYESIKKYKNAFKSSKDYDVLDINIENKIKKLNKCLLYKKVANKQLKEENIKLETEIIKNTDELE